MMTRARRRIRAPLRMRPGRGGESAAGERPRGSRPGQPRRSGPIASSFGLLWGARVICSLDRWSQSLGEETPESVNLVWLRETPLWDNVEDQIGLVHHE